MRTKITCSQWCLDEIPVTPTEERTDQWVALHLAGGVSPVTIGKVFRVAHSQVYKTLKRVGVSAPEEPPLTV